jgi:peptidoglycan/LPS O-acetylase OafA/YrhL
MSTRPDAVGDIAQRIHYLDNLRAFAMILGVFYHASLAYAAVVQDVWVVKDSGSSVALSLFGTLSHLFRMPLFFAIAGFFANMLLEKRGAAGFVRNRAQRIALPFALFLPILGVCLILVVQFTASYLSELPPLLAAGAAAAEAGAPPQVTTAHLWFLYYLMLFYGLALALRRLCPARIAGAVAEILLSPRALPFVPLALLPALASTAVPTPPPEQFVPQLWAVGYHGAFFLFGWHLYRRRSYVERLQAHLVPLALVSLVLFTGFYALLPSEIPLTDLDALLSPPLSIHQVGMAALQAYLSIYLVLIALCLGQRWLSQESPALRYVADASYWIYLVHLPLVLLLQTLLAELAWNPWIKFVTTSAATLAVAGISYDAVVRYTWIGAMLNGRKVRSKRRPRAHDVPAALPEAPEGSGS